MEKYKIYNIVGNRRKLHKNKSLKICSICRGSIKLGVYKNYVYHVTVSNGYGLSYRNSCTKCAKKFLRSRLKNLKCTLENIPAYRKSLKNKINEIEILLKEK